MNKYDFGDVIIDPQDPRVEIGAEYYYATFPNTCIRIANEDRAPMKLTAVWEGGTTGPFKIGASFYYCLIRKREESEKKYIPFDFEKEEDREYLLHSIIKREETDTHCYCEGIVVGFRRADREWVAIVCNMEATADMLFGDWTFADGTPVGKEVEV